MIIDRHCHAIRVMVFTVPRMPKTGLSHIFCEQGRLIDKTIVFPVFNSDFVAANGRLARIGSFPREECCMTDLNQSSPGSGPPGNAQANLVYQELCTSYRSIETFRGRLLGLLPLFSGSGIVLLLNSPFNEIMK